jgi:hypothetical protein
MVAGTLSRYFAYLFFLSAYRGALLPGRVDRRLPLARLLLFDEKVTAPCCTTRKFVDFAGGPAKRSWIGRTKSGGEGTTRPGDTRLCRLGNCHLEHAGSRVEARRSPNLCTATRCADGGRSHGRS